MMKVDLEGNLLNRTASLESGKASINADNFTAAGNKTIIDLSAPDYTAGVDYVASWGSPITTTKAGWVYAFTNNNNGTEATFNINGHALKFGLNGNYSGTGSCSIVRIPANATWSVSGGNNINRQLLFFPCKRG